MSAHTAPQQIIRIVAPSGAMESPELLPRAVQRLIRLGFEVQIDPQCNLIHQRFAGSDAARAQALENAILDPSVDIVMAARGGYGAHRLLPMLDWAKLAKAVNKQGKKLVGHSDFTAIQLALLRHGAPSFAGPCAGVDFGGETVNSFMKASLVDAMSAENEDAAKPSRPMGRALERGGALAQQAFVKNTLSLSIKGKQAQSFNAEGTLWGGNLAMLCSLLGTPYFPKPTQIAGGILFLEDTNERPFRVERMLNQLRMASVLSSQSAVLWGDFGKPAVAAIDRGYGLPSVLKYLRNELGMNVATGLPFGHVPKKTTLPMGQAVRLACTPQSLSITAV
jgi:muramoyltetrapeptide carboxypeptidase